MTASTQTDTLPPLPLNTILILAGTLHGIHAITAKLTPAPGQGGGQITGLDSFEAEGWGGKVYLTPTGKSLLFTLYRYATARNVLVLCCNPLGLVLVLV